MKKILLVLAVAAMVVSSCGMKTNAQGDESKEKSAVEVTTEAPAEKACCAKEEAKADACCEKDSTKCDKESAEKCSDTTECKDKEACCDKDAEKKSCCEDGEKKECEKKDEA